MGARKLTLELLSQMLFVPGKLTVIFRGGRLRSLGPGWSRCAELRCSYAMPSYFGLSWENELAGKESTQG